MTENMRPMPAQAKAARNNHEEAFDVRIILSILKNHWKYLLLGSFLGFLILFIVALPRVAKYQSTAVIQVKGSAPMSGLMDKLSMISSVFSSSSSAGAEVSLLHSRFILEPVVKSLNLMVQVKPKYFPVFGRFVAHHNSPNSNSPLWGWLNTYSWDIDNVRVGFFHYPSSYIGKSMRLVVTSPKHYTLKNNKGHVLLKGVVGVPAFSDAVNNMSMLVSYLPGQVGRQFTVSLYPVDSVVKSIASSISVRGLSKGGGSDDKSGLLSVSMVWHDKEMLPIILNKIINVASAKNILQRSKDAAKSLIFVNNQIPQIKKQLDSAEYSLNKYRSKNNIIDIEQEAKILLEQLSVEDKTLEQIEMKKSLLLQSYTKYHPVIIGLNEKIYAIKKRIGILEHKIKYIPSADQSALSLMRDVKIKEMLYTGLLEQSERLSVMKAGTVSDISILDYSTEPAKLRSHLSLFVLFGLFVGFSIPALFFIFRHIVTDNLFSPDQIENSLGIPVQAVIQYFDKIHKKNNNYKDSSVFSLLGDYYNEPFMEAVRGLRSSLQLVLSDKSKKTITILGSTPNIGKSLLSMCLAYLLYEAKYNVLLIDSDLRRGGIGKFVPNSETGLSEYLAGACTIDAAISSVFKGLDIISSGNYPANPNELFIGNRYKDLLNKMNDKYDYVIVDTPPILAVSDSLLIAKESSCNLFLVGLGRNKIDEVQVAYNRFLSNGIKLDFAICNYCTRLATRYSSSQYGYYYYSYER